MFLEVERMKRLHNAQSRRKEIIEDKIILHHKSIYNHGRKILMKNDTSIRHTHTHIYIYIHILIKSQPDTFKAIASQHKSWALLLIFPPHPLLLLQLPWIL
ncbi:hypothetical protein DM860_002940 [Cuscuta australis]|uniref:Uncharacterized protein n=1 Tax=Cuscuta australis TaxID=267555 RepID=A0A328D0Y4_9ASTE|nr:hypothetical protein DM860_002940 [Cuscuta australis]